MKKVFLILAFVGFLSIDCFSQDAMLGEVRLFAGNFAPKGWALCDGQLLEISKHTALFSILGTMYGGDGRTTFALPNLTNAAAIGVSDSQKQGSTSIAVPIKVSPGEKTSTTQTLAIRYIIATQGAFPSRQ